MSETRFLLLQLTANCILHFSKQYAGENFSSYW